MLPHHNMFLSRVQLLEKRKNIEGEGGEEKKEVKEVMGKRSRWEEETPPAGGRKRSRWEVAEEEVVDLEALRRPRAPVAEATWAPRAVRDYSKEAQEKAEFRPTETFDYGAKEVRRGWGELFNY